VFWVSTLLLCQGGLHLLDERFVFRFSDHGESFFRVVQETELLGTHCSVVSLETGANFYLRDLYFERCLFSIADAHRIFGFFVASRAPVGLRNLSRDGEGF